MSNSQLETAIESAWEARDEISSATMGETRDAIEATLEALDSGKLRVAEGIKKGVILKPPQDNENETWIYS